MPGWSGRPGGTIVLSAYLGALRSGHLSVRPRCARLRPRI